jgi:hypothetical protein
MRKGVAFLPRYRQICAQTNARYLDALAHVDDPTPVIRGLDALTTRASSPTAEPPARSIPYSTKLVVRGFGAKARADDITLLLRADMLSFLRDRATEEGDQEE